MTLIFVLEIPRGLQRVTRGDSWRACSGVGCSWQLLLKMEISQRGEPVLYKWRDEQRGRQNNKSSVLIFMHVCGKGRGRQKVGNREIL